MSPEGNISLRRVLMTADTIGGVWTFAMELCRELAGRGVQVVLATMGDSPSQVQRRQAAAIPGLQLEPSTYKLEWMEEPWRDVEASCRWVLELERQYAPDLVHLNSFGHGALAWQAPMVLTAHSCVASWWRDVKHESLPANWQRYRTLVGRSLKSAHRITVPSRSMRQSLLREYDLDAARHPIDVIPNGRSAAIFRPAEKAPYILAAGRLWDEGKNIAALVKIAPVLSWPVLLAGETGRSGTAAEMAACRTLGHLSPEELGGYLAKASIYALPARYEPFGYSALEAALSGCALVLGDIPSLREIWGDAAVFVPPDDSERLGTVLRSLISNPEQRSELVRRARIRALELSPRRMAASYLTSYGLAQKESVACVS